MNTKIKFIALSLFMCLIFAACDKDPSKQGYQGKPPKPQFHRMKINDELKSYLWSKAGSYWIYKNTKTGDMDTQVCNGFRFDSITSKGNQAYSKHITILYDYLLKSYHSSFSNEVFYEATSKYSADATPFKGLFFAFMREGNGSIISCFHYPFDYPAVSGTGSSYTTYKGMDSTLIIQGKTYFNVAKFEIDKDDIWEEKLNCIRSNNIYYWAKDVGLVKKESKTCNYSWELIKYNIIK